MCAPTTLQEMQRLLAESSWPPTPLAQHNYVSGDFVLKNIADFNTDLLICIDRFEDKLKLLGFTKKAA